MLCISSGLSRGYYKNLSPLSTGTVKSTCESKDLQSKTRIAESWTLHISDIRVDFPVPVRKRFLIIFSFPFSILIRKQDCI